MPKLLEQFDELAGIKTGGSLAARLERIAFIFLILMVLAAPHSIAATQIAWLSGMLCWTIRLFVKPRPKLVRTPLDLALWSFFGWTIVSTIFSYAPDISVGKLRSAALFLIFYFVVNNLRTVRAAKFLSLALISSCLISAAWSPVSRLIGRGVEISNVSAESPLAKGRFFSHDVYLRARDEKNPTILENTAPTTNEITPLIDGDTIVEAEGRKIGTPDELLQALETNDRIRLEYFRNPAYFTSEIRQSDLLAGANSLEKLGIGSWKRNRNWRYAGFYGQIITYAEVLQMIASLALGLFVALAGEVQGSRFKVQGSRFKNRISDSELRIPDSEAQNLNVEWRQLILLFLCLVVMLFALLTTFTRSAEIGILISAAAIILAGGNRKMIFGLALTILPVALIGFFVMQQNRKVDFYDRKDASISYRQTVYREGFDLWTSGARNFFLGVGMDSVKRYKEEWHLFDNGRLETSHFHSTPLQLLIERGFPALLLWFWVLFAYARTLLKAQSSKFEVQALENENRKSKIENPKSKDWQRRGILLGCFGGLIGFFVSSLVNYSLGDGEVAMVFYLLMGIGVSLSNFRFQISDSESRTLSLHF